MIDPNTFFEIDKQRHKGVAIDHYNDTVSLVRCWRNSEGKVLANWGVPQIGKNKYADKAIPWKIECPNKDMAIEALRYILQCLDGKPVDSEDDPEIPF